MSCYSGWPTSIEVGHLVALKLSASVFSCRADYANDGPTNMPKKSIFPESLRILSCEKGRDGKSVGGALSKDIERQILPYLIAPGYERKSSYATVSRAQPLSR